MGARPARAPVAGGRSCSTAIIAWPVAHIGNIAVVAVPVNVALVIAFGSLLWEARIFFFFFFFFFRDYRDVR